MAAIAVGHIPAATLRIIDHTMLIAYTAYGTAGETAGARRSLHAARPAVMNTRPVPNQPARLRNGMPKYGPVSCQIQKWMYCKFGRLKETEKELASGQIPKPPEFRPDMKSENLRAGMVFQVTLQAHPR